MKGHLRLNRLKVRGHTKRHLRLNSPKVPKYFVKDMTAYYKNSKNKNELDCKT
jgi:hypothetical protein